MDFGVDPRPSMVYNTPVVLLEPFQTHVGLPWFERDDACISSGVCGASGASMAENHYYVRFYDDTAGRMCEVNTEEDFGQNDSTQKPVHPLPQTEGISGSSGLIGGSPRRMVSVSMTNGLSSYEMDPTVYPADCTAAGVFCDVYDPIPSTPAGDPTPFSGTGPDASVLVDGALLTAVWGNKCLRAQDCESPSGRVTVASVDPTLFGVELGGMDLGSWVWSAPVGLRIQPAEWRFVLGSDESTRDGIEPGTGSYNPWNADHDCALISMVYDPAASPPLSIVDEWDDEREGWANTCDYVTLPSGEVDGVNGFVGEPVTIGPRTVVLRRRGELYAFQTSVTGSLTRLHRVQFTSVDSVWRIPAEHSLVVGDYPDTETAERVSFFAMNDVNQGGGVIMGLTAASACPPVGPAPWDCAVDPLSALAPTTNRVWRSTRPASQGEPFWGPGAVGVLANGATPPQEELAFFIVESARAAKGGPGEVTAADLDPTGTLVACRQGEAPPGLHIFHKDSTAALWAHEEVVLGEHCYEDATPQGTAAGDPPHWTPIRSVSGVVLVGSSAYVATSDGRFWQYNTVGAGAPGEALVLQGYADGWPRFRKNNAGSASRY